MKNIIRMPLQLTRRYMAASKISRFDKKTDAAANPRASGIEGGFAKLTIDDLFEKPGLTAAMQADPNVRVTPGEKRIHLDWNLPAFVWEAALKSEKLTSLAQDYLGPDVRIDDFYIKTVADGLASVSEGWHTDNVGYRLKVFMVFDTEGTPSGTMIIPRERPNLYSVNLGDEISRALKRPKKENRENAMRVSYEAGDCLVFDTNIPHRGDYSSGQGIRYCLILELIDRNKSDALGKHAACGPGQGQRRIAIPMLDGVDVVGHPLIDERLIDGSNNGYLYGYR